MLRKRRDHQQSNGSTSGTATENATEHATEQVRIPPTATAVFRPTVCPGNQGPKIAILPGCQSVKFEPQKDGKSGNFRQNASFEF